MNDNYKKILMMLNTLALKIKQLSIYLELNWYVNHKQSYIKLVDKSCSGMGKTHSLVMLALKHSIPVIVVNELLKSSITDGIMLNTNFRNVNLPTIISYQEFIDRNYENDVVLVDVGFTEDEIDEIKKQCKVVVGYLDLCNKRKGDANH